MDGLSKFPSGFEFNRQNDLNFKAEFLWGLEILMGKYENFKGLREKRGDLRGGSLKLLGGFV